MSCTSDGSNQAHARSVSSAGRGDPTTQCCFRDACTLVAILRAFADASTIREVETRYRNGGIGYGEVKALLADVIERHVAPLRHRCERLLADPSTLQRRLSEGEQHATRHAEHVLARAMTAMGL